jgi:hypothetical protein
MSMWFLPQHIIFLDLIGILVGEKDAGRSLITLLNVTPVVWQKGIIREETVFIFFPVGGMKCLLIPISFLPNCMV